ncbi:MAG: hypothetical protein AABW88_03750 [Nanoarchaeota archaeon]
MGILDYFKKHFFRVETEAKHIHSYPEGVLGKKVEVRFYEKIKARRSATHAVKEKNAIVREIVTIFRDIKEHKINDVREDTNKAIRTIADGLQHCYNVEFEKDLLAKMDFEDIIAIMNRHGQELDKDQLRFLLKEVADIKQVLAHDERKYLDELVASIEGKELVEGALNRALIGYKVKGLFSPLRPMLEWWAERTLAKEPFKLEARLEKLRARKNGFTMGDIHELLKIEKKFAQNFEKLSRDMSIFSLMLIRTAHQIADEIAEASSEKRYDLPSAMEALSSEIFALLDEEHTALKSLNKARLQLTDLAEKAEESIERALQKEKKFAGRLVPVPA